MDEITARKVYDAYKAGRLSPEASMQYESALQSGEAILPTGITSLNEEAMVPTPETTPVPETGIVPRPEATATPEIVPAAEQIKSLQEAPVLDKRVWDAFQSGQLSEEASKQLFNDIYDGKWQIPYATAEEVGSSFGQDAFTTLQNIGKVYPVLESVANAITSAYGVPASGLAGLLALPFGVENSKKTIDAVQKALVYTPQTGGGEQLTETAAYPMRKLSEGGKIISEPIAEAGYPGTATAIQTAVEAAPLLITGRAPIKSVARGTVAPVLKAGAKTIEAGERAIGRAVETGTETAMRAIGKEPIPRPKPLDNQAIRIIEADPEVDVVIKKGIGKGISPSQKGKMTAGQLKKYYNNAAEAVKEIVKRKDELQLIDKDNQVVTKLPETLDEFQQAVDQVKNSIFREYDSLAQKAEGTGVTIDLTKTVKELKPIFSNDVIRKMSPETLKYAKKRIKELTGQESYGRAIAAANRNKLSVLEAQEAIKYANQSLDAFYANPTPVMKGRAYVDSLIANKLRDQLATAINQSTGELYTPLKRKYGALKAIEDDVRKAAFKDMKKIDPTMADFSDIYTGVQAVRGILKADPAIVASGAAGKGITSYYKMIKNPNRQVKLMFEGVDEILSKKIEGPKVNISKSTYLSTTVKQSLSDQEE